MRFLRVFAQQGLVSNWLEREPPLARLLKCFDVNPAAQKSQVTSVFSVRNEDEEMKTASALFQMSPGTPEKRFGVIIDERDCQSAEIQMDPTEKGNTGIRSVDARHFNLVGTRDKFAALVAKTLHRMWEGEQRLRNYPSQQILGQLAVFSRLPKGEIADESRSNCVAVLNQVSWHIFKEETGSVEIRGKFGDSAIHEIIAVRSFATISFWRKIWSSIRSGS